MEHLISLVQKGASELAGIKLGQINLQAGYIKVMGKGAKERVVPIGKYVRMTLWHYIRGSDQSPPVVTAITYSCRRMADR